MPRVDMDRVEVLDKSTFDSLANAGREVFTATERTSRLLALGCATSIEVEKGNCWPTCGCPERYDCCPDVYTAKCNNEDRCCLAYDVKHLPALSGV